MNVLVLKLNKFVKENEFTTSKQQIINFLKHTRASNKLQYQSLEQKIDLLREYLFDHITATNSSQFYKHKYFEKISINCINVFKIKEIFILFGKL